MDPVRVAVIVGGRSTEHAISCISGRTVAGALGEDPRYAVSIVGILPDGTWVQDPARGLGLLDDSGALPVVDAATPAVTVHEALDVDVVFPVLHGPWGEDGTLQGLLETLGVPYVGSGVLSSSLAMDKGSMKAALAHAGLLSTPHVVVTDRGWRHDRDRALAGIRALGLPVFVKPARAGSSLGIVRVSSESEIVDAVESARKHDPRIIVEAAVSGAREIECGVLADAEGRPVASRCAEIVLGPGLEFYDFDAKYLDDSVRLDVPADLAADVEEEVRALAVRAYDALLCDGLARVDFFVGDDGILVNEVNTMPGFTSISMYPRMWAASGVALPDLVDRLVRDALRKGTVLH